MVDPADEIRSLEPGAALGAFYGVARTGRGSVAVYMAHVNDRFDASVRRYPSLIAALRDGLPNDIAFAALRAAKAQGEE